MKNIKRYLVLVITFTTIISCKKNIDPIVLSPEPVPEKVTKYQDSVSLFMDGKQYIFKDLSLFGVANRGVNIKISDSKDNPGKLMIWNGVNYGHGEKDSTLFSVFYGLYAPQIGNKFEISFSKKFRDNQLLGHVNLLAPKDYYQLLKLGKVPFAVDLDKKNTMEGVSIDLNIYDKPNLGSSIPGTSVFDKSNLKNDIQDNSSFEITKIEKIRDSFYLVEAIFELNLFDNQERSYRAKNGFMRIVVDMRGYFSKK